MSTLSSLYQTSLKEKDQRLESIDVMRGIVMILMALDHCRDYFHVYAFDYAPEDLNFTTPIVFYTRWITHFCAPVFVFLTGISAYLYQQQHRASNKELANYLLVRGLILILLEITIVRFAWRFYIDYSSIGGLVLWAIGWSMVALAILIYLPRKAILYVSLVIIFCHNFLDTIVIEEVRTGEFFPDFFHKIIEFIWAFLHDNRFVRFGDDFGVNILYPVLPMIGVIGLGYYIGKWFTMEYSSEIRSGYLFYVGFAMCSLFVGLRFFQLFTEQYSYLTYLKPEDLQYKWLVFFKEIFTHLIENYGDPAPWQPQENFKYTMIAFFNTTKYPMSLLYILMTLGPAFIVLSILEGKKNIFTGIMKTFGRVPLFYYVIHLFIIHTLAIVLAVLTHLTKFKEIIAGDWKALSENYGFSMPVVYLIWLGVLGILYPICLRYGRIKSSKKYKFLSFL